MPARNKPAPSRPETPLKGIIREQIAADGPLSVADFMDLALNHPEHGYYQCQEPFGAGGDFVTAPEISQVFGELIGVWLATAWQEMGRPAPFRMVELGPGRGQLMADFLRATSKVPGFLEAADINLVESSKRLADRQQQMLAGYDITWHERLETVPSGPLILIANEFFDALPVHQLVWSERGWRERRVTVDDGGALSFTNGDAPMPLARMLADVTATEPGQIAEISPAREVLAQSIGRRLRQDGGLAVIIDYGAWVDRATGDTLQAVRGHRPADPLAFPGKIDLTTQVDFRRLGLAAAGGSADVFGPVPQGPFLRTLGIEMRMAALIKQADELQRQSLREALFRLTDASAMGELFKVLVLGSPKEPPPAGLCRTQPSRQIGHMIGKEQPTPMERALLEAEAAAMRDEVPVGAVIVSASGEVIASNGNRMREHHDPTAHAEILVIREAARTLCDIRLPSCDLYVTLEPCPMCAAAISFARIRRLYYGAGDPKGGAVDHGPRLFASGSCHHTPEIYGGIGERRATALLKDFFQARR